MTFDQYWETDEAFAYRHADERTQAEAAWNAAILQAAKRVEQLMNEWARSDTDNPHEYEELGFDLYAALSQLRAKQPPR